MNQERTRLDRVLESSLRKESILIVISLVILALLFRAAENASSTERLIVISTGCLLAAVIALYGIKYFISDLTSPQRYTITPEDRPLLEPLIVEANEKAIDQYVRISSLSGSTGAATRLGLTGLPLATIGLTVFFSLAALIQPSFLDLAQLSLGAFIGSFVQKAVAEVNAGGRASVASPPPEPGGTSAQKS